MVKRLLVLIPLLAAVAVYGARNKAMQQKPLPGAVLNPTHPWANGMIAAYIFPEESGTGFAESLHGKGVNSLFVNGALTVWQYDNRTWASNTFEGGNGQTVADQREVLGAGGIGRALRVHKNAGIHDQYTGSDYYFPSGEAPFSLLMHVVFGIAPGGGAADQYMFSYGTVASHQQRSIGTQTNTTLVWAGNFDDFTGTIPTVVAHTSAYIGATWDGTAARLFYGLAPGRMKQVGSATPSPNIVKTGTISFGSNPAGSDNFWDGWIDYAYAWNRPIPIELLNAITLSPFDIFLPSSPVWTRYNYATSTAGGLLRRRTVTIQ